MVSAGIQPTLLLCDGAEKFFIRPKQFSAQPWWFNFVLKLVKWLKEVQKGCRVKYLFYFTMWPLGQLEFKPGGALQFHLYGGV